MSIFSRKLRALGFPNFGDFDHSDKNQFQELVVWLEDHKIRQYKLEDRPELRNTSDYTTWLKAFSKYLDDLHCPHEDRTNTPVILDWLLGLAVRLTYGENPEKYRKCKGNSKSMSNGASQSANPLDSLDFDDEGTKSGINSLATLLRIPPHHDHKEVLKAVCKLVKERLSAEKLLQLESTDADASKDKLDLESMDMGFHTGDYVTEEAVKILRLLHIQNLRQLQSQINEALVSVQNVTANPKTDQRLGKIGR